MSHRCSSRLPRPFRPATVVALLVGLATLATPFAARAQLQSVAIAIGGNATLGSVSVTNDDIVICDPISYGPGTTSCNWRMLFDGSTVGLNSSVRALDVLPNGNLVIRVGGDNSIPDLSAIKTKDLALFIPTNAATMPYTDGEWRLFLDGDAVKGASDARSWDAVDVLTDGTCENDSPMTCDVLLSLPSGAALGGVSFSDEDIVKCTPTAWSVGGAITACTYSLYLDSSAINAGGAGSFTGNLHAIDQTDTDTMIFRANNQATLPPAYDAARDLLRYVGTFGLTPVGTVDIFFDGGGAGGAGLDGETIQAFSFIADADGDQVPDGIDNCPTVPNPGQENADDDDLGDDCDYCPFRADPTCVCGDAVADPPSEECDLGVDNGASGSPCSATCEILGSCSDSMTPCDDVSDCPVGEGCCGDAITSGTEECDDGNNISDDLCSGTCTLTPQGVPIIGCEDVTGPHLMPAFIKTARFVDSKANPGFGLDKWKVKGDFTLSTGITIDPDSQEVRVILNQAGPAPLYEAVLPAGNFVQKGSTNSPNWKFSDKQADVAGALGLKKTQVKRQLNRVPYSIDGVNVIVPIDFLALGAPPIRLRQSLRIGDDCATAVLRCVLAPNGNSLKCTSAP